LLRFVSFTIQRYHAVCHCQTKFSELFCGLLRAAAAAVCGLRLLAGCCGLRLLGCGCGLLLLRFAGCGLRLRLRFANRYNIMTNRIELFSEFCLTMANRMVSLNSEGNKPQTAKGDMMQKIIKALAAREIRTNGPTRTCGFWETLADMMQN